MGTTTTKRGYYKPASGETGYGSLVNANMDDLDNAWIDSGAWLISTAYKVGNVIQLTGVSYICKLAHTGQTPPNATYWTPAVTVAGLGALLASNNLSDVTVPATALSNIGAAATTDSRFTNARVGLIPYGTHASRPGSQVDQSLYYETDTTSLFQYETGTGWVQVSPSVATVATNVTSIATNTSSITTINNTIGSPNTASHFLQLDSNTRLPIVAGVPMDFGNDYIDGLAADGADMSIRCARNLTVISGDVGFDANPAQTMTLTLQQRRAGSVIASATLTVSTGGVVTPAGFPIASILAGDRLRVNLSGTANVTGLNYVFKARAES